MKGCLGSTHYSSPEILKGNSSYDEKCDIWSIGIITYLLFSQGEFPFDGNSEQEIIKSIKRGEFYLPPARRRDISKRKRMADYEEETPYNWENMSENAKDFITLLLRT